MNTVYEEAQISRDNDIDFDPSTFETDSDPVTKIAGKLNGGINLYDSANVDDKYLAPGEYEVLVVRCEETTFANGNYGYRVTVQGPEYRRASANFGANRKFISFLLAAGMSEAQIMRFYPEDLVDRRLQVRIAVRVSNGVEYNNIVGWEPIG